MGIIGKITYKVKDLLSNKGLNTKPNTGSGSNIPSGYTPASEAKPAGTQGYSSSNPTNAPSNSGNTGTKLTGKSGGGSSSSTSSLLTNSETTTTPLQLSSSGEVSVGKGKNRRTYTGNAYINDLGMTANQYNQSVRNEINADRKAQGKKAIGMGRYSSKGEIQTTTTYTETPMGNIGGLSNAVFGEQEYASDGSYLYSGQTSAPNLQGAFPKFEEKIWRNNNLTGFGIFGTKLFVPFSSVKEKLPNVLGVGSGVTAFTKEYIKQDILGIKTNKINTSYDRGYSTGKTMGGVVSEFIPTNPKEVTDTGLMFASGSYYSKLSSTNKILMSSSVAVLGGSTALNKELTPEQRIGGALVGGLGVLGVTGESYKVATKPITIKITKPNQEFYSASVQNTIRQGDKSLNVASFNILGYNSPRLKLTVPQYELWSLKPYKINYKQMTFEQATDFFGKQGKVSLYSKPSLTSSMTEPFIINKEGFIQEPLRRNGARIVGVDILKATPTRTSRYVTKLEGQSFKDEFNINQLTKKMSPEEAQAFKQLKEITTNEQGTIGTAKVFDSSQKFSFGNIKTTDLLKVNKQGGVKIIPQGKRTNRGLVVGTRNEMFKVEFPNEFGLKETAIFNERIGFTDVTFPRVNKPKQGKLIKGIAKENYYEIPSPSEPVNFIFGSGGKSSPEFLKQLYETPKAELQQKMASVAKTQSILKSNPIYGKSNPTKSTTPLIDTTRSEILYPKTNKINSQNQLSLGNELQRGLVETRFRTDLFGASSVINRNSSKSRNRSIAREVPREITKEVTKEIQRTNQRLTQRTIQRQVSKNVLKSSNVNRFFNVTPKPIVPKVTPPFWKPKFKLRNKSKSNEQINIIGDGYNPSFTASALNIRASAKEIKRLKKLGVLGGLSLRPIVDY